MSLLSMCRTMATLYRQTATKDASGGIVNTNTAVSGYADLPCDIQPASGTMRMQYMHMEALITHSMYFADPVPCYAGDSFTSVDDDGTTHRYLFRGIRPKAPGYQQWACIVDVEEHANI